MQSITIPQLKKLHCLLGQLGIMEEKKDIILHYTQGRTDSASKLTKDEATNIIGQLAKIDPCEKHRKAIWHLAFLAGIVYGESYEDKYMNIAKLNMFLREKSVAKKDLNKMNMEELKKVHKQFEAIVRNTRKTADNKVAKARTSLLLKELSITTS